MFLKRLEISAFKSFADKIKLDFPAGITAVVGPNGSGKSNIADAVRWVMGEQSAKSLRGSKMEDVIFSGTQHRRPLGYAEVQMLIDNSEGLLSVPFDEVNVTRRVFRSGESEYRLNGTSCRMRDIHALFMDTGVGREGYSIIGQGRVDEILSTRSEDRRYLFEEAAGIVKYKSRRQETFQKLEAEKQNLQRAEDLIEELKNQLGPLAEQAEQAKHYLALRDEYKIIHINLFLEEAAQAEAQGERIKKQLHNLSEQSKEEEEKLTNTQKNLVVLKEQESDTESTYKELNRQIINQIRDIEKADSNMRISERIEKEIAQRTVAMDQKQADKEEAEKAQEVLRKELSLAKGLMAEKEKAHSAFEKKLEELYSLNTRHKLLTEMEQAREGYYASVKTLLRKKDQDSSFGAGIFGTVSELITVPQTYEQAISVALGSAAQNILTATAADAQRAINYLKSAKAGRATFLPIASMRQRNTSAEMDRLLQEPGTIDLAVNLVTFDADYLSVFSHLLGNVFVLEDLKGAIEISRKYRQAYRIVTLDGDLISPGGAMTGGSLGRQASELLSRSRQISELSEKIESLADSRQQRDESNSQLTDHKVYISRLSQDLQRAVDRARKSAEELSSMATERADLESELSKLHSGLAPDGGLEALRLELDQQQESLSASESEVAKLRTEITKAEVLQQEQQELIAQLSRETARLETRYEQIETESHRLHKEVWESYSLTQQSAQELRNPEYTTAFLRQEERRIKSEMTELGPVNVGAIEAHQAIKQRYDFLTTQRDDILEAEEQLQDLVNQLTEQMEQQFKMQFDIIAKHFNDVFKEMFGGGNASLSMSEPGQVLESGIEISAQPPGKNLQSLSLLSGGERALTAIALLFGILRMKPSPFCILDEIESALDDANVKRFASFLKEYAGNTQFIVITHRKGTMESADTLHGVTMQELGVSKLVSVDFR